MSKKKEDYEALEVAMNTLLNSFDAIGLSNIKLYTKKKQLMRIAVMKKLFRLINKFKLVTFNRDTSRFEISESWIPSKNRFNKLKKDTKNIWTDINAYLETILNKRLDMPLRTVRSSLNLSDIDRAARIARTIKTKRDVTKKKTKKALKKTSKLDEQTKNLLSEVEQTINEPVIMGIPGAPQVAPGIITQAEQAQGDPVPIVSASSASSAITVSSSANENLQNLTQRLREKDRELTRLVGRLDKVSGTVKKIINKRNKKPSLVESRESISSPVRPPLVESRESLSEALPELDPVIVNSMLDLTRGLSRVRGLLADTRVSLEQDPEVINPLVETVESSAIPAPRIDPIVLTQSVERLASQAPRVDPIVLTQSVERLASQAPRVDPIVLTESKESLISDTPAQNQTPGIQAQQDQENAELDQESKPRERTAGIPQVAPGIITQSERNQASRLSVDESNKLKILQEILNKIDAIESKGRLNPADQDALRRLLETRDRIQALLISGAPIIPARPVVPAAPIASAEPLEEFDINQFESLRAVSKKGFNDVVQDQIKLFKNDPDHETNVDRLGTILVALDYFVALEGLKEDTGDLPDEFDFSPSEFLRFFLITVFKEGLISLDPHNQSEQAIELIGEIESRLQTEQVLGFIIGGPETNVDKLFKRLINFGRLPEDSLITGEPLAFGDPVDDDILTSAISAVNNDLSSSLTISDKVLRRIQIIINTMSFDSLKAMRSAINNDPINLFNPVGMAYSITNEIFLTFLKRIIFFGVDISRVAMDSNLDARLLGQGDDRVVNHSMIRAVLALIDNVLERPEDPPEVIHPRSNQVPTIPAISPGANISPSTISASTPGTTGTTGTTGSVKPDIPFEAKEELEGKEGELLEEEHIEADDDEPIRQFQENIEKSALAAAFIAAGVKVASFAELTSNYRLALADKIADIPIPAGINPVQVRDAILRGARDAAPILRNRGLGFNLAAALFVGGLAGALLRSMYTRFQNLFTTEQLNQIGLEVRTGARGGTTTEFFKGEERIVPVENIDTPQGEPKLRPEFKQLGIDFFNRQFNVTPLDLENSEWAEFNYVPLLDRNNGVEMSNKLNDDIRFREPLFLPKYRPPQKPPSMQSIIMTSSLMNDQIQINQPFKNKFDGAVNLTDNLSRQFNETAFDRNWDDNILFHPDRSAF